MKTVTLGNVRANLTSIIADLANGPIALTKHGKTIAVLSAPETVSEAPESPKPAKTRRKAKAASETPPTASEPMVENEEEEEEGPMEDDAFAVAFAEAIATSEAESDEWDDALVDEAWDAFMESREKNKEARKLFRV